LRVLSFFRAIKKAAFRGLFYWCFVSPACSECTIGDLWVGQRGVGILSRGHATAVVAEVEPCQEIEFLANRDLLNGEANIGKLARKALGRVHQRCVILVQQARRRLKSFTEIQLGKDV